MFGARPAKFANAPYAAFLGIGRLGSKGASRLDGVLDRARRRSEKLKLGPKRLKELPEDRLRIANNSKCESQAHRVQARALQGGKVL